MSEINDKLEQSLKQLNRDLEEIEQALREHESQNVEAEEIDKPENSISHTFMLAFFGSLVGSIAATVIINILF